MEDSYAVLFIRNINETKNALAQSLCMGRARDFAEYREMCGRLHGLNTALLLLEEIQERQREHDD